MNRTLTPDEALRNWSNLNAFLLHANEEEVNTLLSLEREGANRVQYLIRIHGRVNKLRVKRERKDILKKAVK